MNRKQRRIAAGITDVGPTRGIKRFMEKAQAFVDRTIRKQNAAKRIRFHGVTVTRKIVKSHRYLRDHGLPHSESAANVLIGES